MKKITIMALCILLLITLVCTTVLANAGSADLTASVSRAKPGDTVEFVVSVANFLEADSMSVSVTVPDGLTVQEGKWVLRGLMSDYMTSVNRGIWASAESIDLSAKTDVFKLTCVVNEPEVGQQDLSKEVKIVVEVKADGSSKGKLETSAQVEVYNPATELTLNKQTLQFDLSGTNTEQLVATVNPQNTTETLSWSSSNNAVATVSADGTVTAVAEGEAVITACVGELEKKCTVTVACGHSNKTEHSANDSTCQVNGNNLYYTCDICGDAFKADGITETTVQAETLPLADHKGGTASCSAQAVCEWCNQPYGDTLQHTFTEQIENEDHFVAGSGADCQSLKEYYYDCAECDAISTVDKFSSATYGEHKVSSEWTSENDTHFHKCTVSGCTYKEDEAACYGGNATCKDKAVCDICNTGYGELISCQFTAENPTDEHLVSAATCTQQAVYFKSCVMCDASGTETFDHGELKPHNFLEKIEDDTHFVAGSGEDCQHAKQYYYDCTACTAISNNKFFDSNTYGEHNISTEWTTENEKHFHKCTVSGCTHKEDEAACYGGTATCTAKATCVECQKTYGEVLPHNYSNQWTSTGKEDTDKHYRLCTDCQTAKTDESAHDFEWVVDSPATEDITGTKHEECACGEKRSEDTEIPLLPHTHIDVTHYPAVAATCKKTGTVEYWTCASHKCDGKYYGNEAGTVVLDSIVTPIDEDNHAHIEIKDQVAANCYKDGYSGDIWCLDCANMILEGEVIEATGKHKAGNVWYSDNNKHWHTCTTEGCTALVGKTDHSYEWKVDTAATEDSTGIKHEECVCGVKRSEGTIINKLDHVHIGITHHAAVKATCVSAGTVEYWTCNSKKCANKYYSDDACQLEIKNITEAINASNHVELYVVDKVNATCVKGGYTGDTWCSKCNVLVEKGEVTLATGIHTATGKYMNDKNNHWKVCDCGEHVKEATHTTEIVNAKEATETETGYTGDEVCSVCGYTVKKGEQIPVLPASDKESDTTEITQSEKDDDLNIKLKNIWIVPAVIVAIFAAAVVIFVIIKKRRF